MTCATGPGLDFNDGNNFWGELNGATVLADFRDLRELSGENQSRGNQSSRSADPCSSSAAPGCCKRHAVRVALGMSTETWRTGTAVDFTTSCG